MFKLRNLRALSLSERSVSLQYNISWAVFNTNILFADEKKKKKKKKNSRSAAMYPS